MAATATGSPDSHPSIAARALRGVPGFRRVARSLRAGWQRRRPFPRPRYLDSTPRIGGDDPWHPFFPPTAGTVGSAAISEEAADFVMNVLDKLTPTEDHVAEAFYYSWSRAKFGEHLRYADLLTTLWAAATFVQPANYLEVGVHRGRGCAVVGSACPDVAIYGFDLWDPDYVGRENPGPDFVRDELRAVGHTGDVVLVPGDSRKTLPAFLRERPQLSFGLITIDGDKSVRGFGGDVAAALPRLQLGGVLIVDDLAVVPVLRRVWRAVIEQDRRFLSWEFADGAHGVAVAVRMT